MRQVEFRSQLGLVSCEALYPIVRLLWQKDPYDLASISRGYRQFFSVISAAAEIMVQQRIARHPSDIVE
jgi:hypothetical protein